MVPKGLLIAVSIGITAGGIFGAYLVATSNNDQILFVQGPSLSLKTDKPDYKKGQDIEIRIINSGSVPLMFSDSGLKITALDGTLIYLPNSQETVKTLEPQDESKIIWNQIKNDGNAVLEGTYKIYSEATSDDRLVKKSITINILK